MGQGETRRCTNCCHHQDSVLLGKLWTSFVVTISLFAYLVVGVGIFRHVEGVRGTANEAHKNFHEIRDNFTQAVGNLCNGNTSNFTAFFTGILDEYESLLAEAAKGPTGPDLWTWTSTALFCVSVVTTVGDGYLAPVTQAGRIVCMVYALFGIPICLLFLSYTGDVIAMSFRVAVGKCLQHLRKKRHQHNGVDRRVDIDAGLNVVSMETTNEHGYGTRSNSRSGRGAENIGYMSDSVDSKGEGSTSAREDIKTVKLSFQETSFSGNFADFVPRTRTGNLETDFSRKGRIRRSNSFNGFDWEVFQFCHHHGNNLFHFPFGLNNSSRVNLHSGNVKSKPDKAGCFDYSNYVNQNTLPVPSKEANKKHHINTFGAEGKSTQTDDVIQTNYEDEADLPVPIMVLILVIYFVGGAQVFGDTDGWTMFDGLYFCFITVSTIGFGDMEFGYDFTTTMAVGLVLYVFLGLIILSVFCNLSTKKMLEGGRKIHQLINGSCGKRRHSNESLASQDLVLETGQC